MAGDGVFDIAVMGAGPAGAVAARRLKRLGYDVALIARRQPRGIIEGLSKRAYDGLVHAGCEAALGAVSPLVPRFAAWGGSSQAANGEYLIGRDAFDAGLRQDAANAGVPVIEGRISGLDDQHGVWTIRLHDNGAPHVRARYLIDARGRQAPRQKLLGRGPKTLALCRRFEAVPSEPGTMVESLDSGWLWAAFPGDGSAWLQAVIDPDSMKIEGPEDLLGRSTMIAPRLDAARAAGDAVARDAAAVLHGDLVTPRRLRVGDAAFAIDPLSGHGLYEAVAGALRAAAVVHTLMQHPERGGIARRFYEARAHGAFLRHARTGRDFYRAEPRFAEAPFWTARRDWPDDEAIHAAPHSEPPQIKRRPVLIGQVIEERDVVVTADHPDGVYVIDGVPLVPLIRLAGEANSDAALLAENFAATPAQIERALTWLRLRGLIADRLNPGARGR